VIDDIIRWKMVNRVVALFEDWYLIIV